MHGNKLVSLALACCLFLLLLAPGIGMAKKTAPVEPRVFRIGILEAGPNWVHDKMLAALQASLRAKGWGDKVDFPRDGRKVGTWSLDGRASTHLLAAQLMARQDLDCILAIGTEAAQALLAKNNGKTAIVAMTLSDPIASGVVKNEKDSGVANLTTCVVPDQWVNMLRLFYSVVRFKKLGVIYQDTPAGRTYTNLEDARDVSREKGVTLVEYNRLEGEASTNNCRKGLEWLISQGVDAFYIPDVPCFDWTENDPGPLFALLNKHKVATFARTGLPLVQLGALMGSCSFSLDPLAAFHADQLIAIFSGASPRSLKMIMPDDLGLSLNLETARKLRRDFPADVLVSADVIVARTIDLKTVRKWY